MLSKSKKIPHIILVDDHLIFRQGIKSIINFENIGYVIGEASNGKEFINLLSTNKPDLVLMDIDMPEINGFEATKLALNIHPNMRIIVFSAFAEQEYFFRMIELGVKGFILKTSGLNELETAIEKVMNGEQYFSSEFQPFLQDEMPKEYGSDKVINSMERNDYSSKSDMLFFSWNNSEKLAVSIK